MPRHLRLEFPGAIYHITIRGNARQQIFGDDRDRERFLFRLAESVETYRIRLYLFCLMGNHVHLLLETPDTNLSRFMQSLETGYTVYYNLRHRTVGHLFQGRYRAKLVEGDEYLLKLSRYIHLNPVLVGRSKGLPLKQGIAYLRNYCWSSYRSYIRKEKELDYVTYGPVLRQMGGMQGRRARQYRGFVESGLTKTDEEFLEVLKESPHAIGGDEFRAWAHDMYLQLAGKKEKPEDIAFRQQAQRLPSEVVLRVVEKYFSVGEKGLQRRRRNSLVRPVAAKMLSKYAGLTNRAIAKILGLTSAGTVTEQLRRAMAATAVDKKMTATLEAVEADLCRRISGIEEPQSY